MWLSEVVLSEVVQVRLCFSRATGVCGLWSCEVQAAVLLLQEKSQVLQAMTPRDGAKHTNN